MASGIFRVPLHSSVRVENYQNEIKSYVEVEDYSKAKEIAGRWLSVQSMNWRAYFQRAQLTLSDSGNNDEAAADFRRGSFR